MTTPAGKTPALTQKGMDLLMDPKRIRVGQTPADVIYTEGTLRLLHYRPRTAQRHAVPVLIVYALVNRPYILDLLPGRSVVEILTAGGLDVYLIDWGTPGPSDQWKTLHQYVNGYIHRCVQQVKEAAGAEQVTLFGYCQGGTLATIYTALHPKEVKSLMVMASPFGLNGAQASDGLLLFWSDPRYFNVDKLVDAYGNIPVWLLNTTFQWLKPVQNMVDKYVRFAEDLAARRADDQKIEMFLAMEKWISDGIPHPGEAFREFVKGVYQQNLLVQHRLQVGGRVVNLKNIQCPVFNIVADQDHLVPPALSLALNEAVGSRECETVRFPTGHVGLSVGSLARKELWPRAVRWLTQHSQNGAGTAPPSEAPSARQSKPSAGQKPTVKPPSTKKT